MRLMPKSLPFAFCRIRSSVGDCKCVESGTHAELVAAGGLYARLVAAASTDLIVATDDQVIHFHRDHRGPEDHPVIRGRFFAQADSA